jgi:hypothetical protein
MQTIEKMAAIHVFEALASAAADAAANATPANSRLSENRIDAIIAQYILTGAG